MGGLNGATGLGYDASGNLTGYNGMTLSWDNWGQLIGATNTPLGNVTYTYDALGRRASKTVGGATTLYLYDGDALIGEVNGATGQLTRSYTWGAIGLISDHSSTGSRYYMFDPAGHTRALLDANGNTLAQQAYTSYGQQVGTALPTPFAWNGACGIFSDPETGLLYMRARYYSPSIGRFISRDPIGFDGGINVYAYCEGDPLNYCDPNGNDWKLTIRASNDHAWIVVKDPLGITTSYGRWHTGYGGSVTDGVQINIEKNGNR